MRLRRFTFRDEPDLREALERAVESLDSGKALSKLEELAKITKAK
jgi:anthranilate phosphoribosyltransferase